MSVSVEEKLKLMEEAGMEKAAQKMRDEIKAKELVESIAGMKFRMTSESRIRKQICGFYWNLKEFPFRHRAQLQSLPLEKWEGNIPYGGLLAVKEAKGHGLKHFVINYPCTKEHDRLKKDPVIVGYFDKTEEESPFPGMFSSMFGPSTRTVYKGPMIEVFAWDDGKVYE